MSPEFLVLTRNQPIAGTALVSQMRLEAGHALASHDSLVDGPGGQLQAVARMQGELLAGPRQAERDGAAHAEDHLVIVVAVSSVDIMRRIGPGIGRQALALHEIAQTCLAWGLCGLPSDQTLL